MQPFVIYALPRSRTYWLSRFLSYGDWTCGHDEIRHVRGLEDVNLWFKQPNIGTIETAAAPFWRLLEPLNLKTVIIRRPIDDVVGSLLKTGLPFDVNGLTKLIKRLDQKLDQIEARVSGVLSVKYADLADETTCQRLFECCLPYQHDHRWWSALAAVNLQINLAALMRYYQAYKGPLDKAAQIARHRMLSTLGQRPVRDLDDVTFQTETFDTFFRDGQRLFSEHLVQVDEAPDAFTGKNIPLMRALDDAKCLQVMTARCNGRMVGYLMSVISPSLESEKITTAVQTTFFASPDFPGTGIKLQRSSIAALRDRGATEIVWRAGTRGSGPRMAPLYKRLGAVNTGQLYLLSL